MSRTSRAREPDRPEHRAAGRVLDIVEFLGRSRDGFTLSALSRQLRVPKSSLLALLRTFVERGYLERQSSGAYRLGARAMAIGLRPAGNRELPAVARPILIELAEKSGESAFLGVLTRDPAEVVYVDKVESRQRIRYTAELGERRPLYCSAPGLAILAFMPDAARTRMIRSLSLRPFTDRTVTERERLRTRLDEIRRTGVVVNVDAFITGASGIAAPIFDAQGIAGAACTVIGPTDRLLAQREQLVKWVKAAGDRISHRLGFQPG